MREKTREKEPKKENLARDFVKECKQKFGDRLKCVVLFGSRAKGKAERYSDWDFLVIAEDLPQRRPDRIKSFRDIKHSIVKKYSETISPVSYEPRELVRGPINPLMFGILTGYKVLYGREFWKDYLRSLRNKLKDRNPIYIEEGREWKVKKMIH